MHTISFYDFLFHLKCIKTKQMFKCKILNKLHFKNKGSNLFMKMFFKHYKTGAQEVCGKDKQLIANPVFGEPKL